MKMNCRPIWLICLSGPFGKSNFFGKANKSNLPTWHKMIYSTHSSLNRIWRYSIGIVKIIQEGTCVFLSLVKVEVYARIGVSDNPYLALDK